MKIRGKVLSLCAAAALLFAGCSTDGTDDRDYTGSRFEISTEQTVWNFASGAQTVFIPFNTTVPSSAWNIAVGGGNDTSWVSVDKVDEGSQKGVYLSVAESEEPEVRSAVVKISAAFSHYELTLRQLGYGPAILVDNKTLGQGGGTFEITVTTNIDIKIGEPDYKSYDKTWLEVLNDGKPLSRALENYSYEVFAAINFDPFVRSAEITFSGADEEYEDVTAVCVVTQDVGSADEAEVNPDKQSDTQVKASRVTASSVQSGAPASFLIDGIKTDNSLYHSKWASSGGTSWPVTWTFDFSGSPTIDYFKLWTRAPGGVNGLPGAFSVQYKGTGTNNQLVAVKNANGDTGADNPLGNFNQIQGTHTCWFPESLVGVTQMVITWYDGYGDMLSAQEIEFWKDNSNMEALNSSLLDIFTDLSCSELRSDVDEAKIKAFQEKSPYLAQSVAARMFDGTFPTFNDEKEREFRIHSYEAYSSAGAMAKTYRTKAYTSLDNPTGIYVQAGERLVVCVDEIPAGNSVSLAISGEASDGYTAFYSGFQQNVALKAGVNEIDVEYEGLCFILNTVNNLTSSSKPVKVHFLPEGGHVDGYVDVYRHGDAECNAMVNSAQYKYFFMKGRNISFWMHTSVIKGYTNSTGQTALLSGLDAWDQIIGWQLEVMGLAEDLNPETSDWWGHDWDRKVDETHFNNHILAVSNMSPDVYMDASDFRINFSATTGIPKIITRYLLLADSDNSWGPAHESGHVNQGAINWKSTTESSNNLFSNIALYHMGKYGSRGKSVTQLGDEYANGNPWVTLGDGSYKGEDSEIHMRMNWQLWNYFHRCGYDTEFWPKLFALLRTQEYALPNAEPSQFSMTEDAGACQMNFAKAVCEAAQMDFTDFFDAWGFFRTVNISFESYGTVQYTVTQTMINSFKTWISQKGYPKAPPVQYIEDRNTLASGFYSTSDAANRGIGSKYSDFGYYTAFRDKTIVSGTPKYTRSGSTYTITGAEGAVAIELREAGSGSTLGTLKYFSNLATFTVPDVISESTLASLKVYAVQYDNTRIEISAN